MLHLSPVLILYWQKLLKCACKFVHKRVGVEGSKEKAKFRIKKCKGQMLMYLLALRIIKHKDLLDLE